MAADATERVAPENTPPVEMDGEQIISVVLERDLIDEWVRSRGGHNLHLPHPYDEAGPWCGWWGDFKTTPVEAHPELFHGLCDHCRDKWNDDGYPLLDAPLIGGGETDGITD